MAKQRELKVAQRTDTGKGACRTLRNEGLVPGIYYDSKGGNIPVKVKEGELKKLYSRIGSSHVFQLTIEGQDEKRPCFIWELKRHPFKSKYVHVDFYGVDLNKKIKVVVPVEAQGTAKGQDEGGVLTLFRDMLEVECLPLNVPDSIVIDVSELGVNDSVQIEDVQVPGDVELVYEENFAVLGVTVPSLVEETTEGEEAEGEEGEAEAAEAAEGSED